MTDFFKDSPAYHWMTDDAREEGLEQGREQGLKEGFRQAIAGMIAGRYPTVTRLAEKQLPLIQHVAPLEKLVMKINMAQTVAEVKQYLVEAVDESIQSE